MKRLFTCAVLLGAALIAVPASAQNVIPGIGRNAGGGVHNSTGNNGAPRQMGGGRQFQHGGNFAQGGGQRFQGGGERFHGGGERYHGGNGWAAGAAGLAAGAIVGGAIAANNGYYNDAPDYADAPPPAPYYNDDPGYAYGAPPAPNYADEGGDASVSYCEQTYHSYDPASGTYLGFDGQRHSCP